MGVFNRERDADKIRSVMLRDAPLGSRAAGAALSIVAVLSVVLVAFVFDTNRKYDLFTKCLFVVAEDCIFWAFIALLLILPSETKVRWRRAWVLGAIMVLMTALNIALETSLLVTDSWLLRKAVSKGPGGMFPLRTMVIGVLGLYSISTMALRCAKFLLHRSTTFVKTSDIQRKDSINK